METQSENEAIIELMRDIDGTEMIGLDGIPVFASVPKGRTLQSIKAFVNEYRTEPERIEGTAVLNTLDSFIKHVLRFKDANTGVFANDGDQPSLKAVYDYHAAGAPRFGRHRATYNLKLSSEWDTWQAADGKWMSQVDFAVFLEDRLGDILDPADVKAPTLGLTTSLGLNLASRQKLLTLSEGLTVNVDLSVTNSQNLSSGEHAVSFAEKHKDAGGQTLKVPNGFVIAIPVFHGGDAYTIPVRLRYRVKEGKISWCVVVINAQKAIDAAVKEAVVEVETTTGIQVLIGEPEPKQ